MKALYLVGVVTAAVALTASMASGQYNPAPAPSNTTAPAQAAPIAGAAPAAATTIDGQIQAVSVTCRGAVPDTCSATADIVERPSPITQNGSEHETNLAYGNSTRIYVPAGMLITWGDRQVPVTMLAVGDEVRLDYTTYASTSGTVNLAVNTASAGTLVFKQTSQ